MLCAFFTSLFVHSLFFWHTFLYLCTIFLSKLDVSYFLDIVHVCTCSVLRCGSFRCSKPPCAIALLRLPFSYAVMIALVRGFRALRWTLWLTSTTWVLPIACFHDKVNAFEIRIAIWNVQKPKADVLKTLFYAMLSSPVKQIICVRVLLLFAAASSCCALHLT